MQQQHHHMQQQAVANCERCGAPMRLAEKRTEKSYPFKLAKVPKGFCANCVVTEFLYNTYPVNSILDGKPEILLSPHMREAFMPLLKDCDMNVDEIDWATVHANWSLPVKVTKDAKNCYRMGDAARERANVQAFDRQNEAFEDALAKTLGHGDPAREESIRKQARAQRSAILGRPN